MTEEGIGSGSADPEVEPAEQQQPGVVAIGSSAGGLEALRLLVRKLPVSANFAYIIAQHLPPRHPSMLTELLRRETALPVAEAVPETPILPGRIYVTPPNANVTVSEGKLRLQSSGGRGPKPNIDTLLESLAREFGNAVIAVILSGSGSGGAKGVRAVREAGGYVIAQSSEQARYRSMPDAACATGCVDAVLDAEQIGPHLESLRAGQVSIPPASMNGAAGSELDAILAKVLENTNIDFRGYKTKTILRRVGRRMAALHIGSLSGYARYLDTVPDESAQLAQSCMISVTGFYRDLQAFEELGAILAERFTDHPKGQPIRVWVPACATGEEAYTLAILFARLLPQRRVQIFGTDIDEKAIQTARRAHYVESHLHWVPEALVRECFRAAAGGYQLEKRVRDHVIFARHDILCDPLFMNLDLISCRNFLMYLKNSLQEEVLRRFHYALKPGGLLFLGRSEHARAPLFDTVSRRNKIFENREHARAGRRWLAAGGGPGRHDTPACAISRQREPDAAMQQALLNAFAPPAVLVDQSFRVLESHGDPGRFLTLQTGKPDLTLFSLVPKPLAASLRAQLHRARRAGRMVRGTPRPVETGGRKLWLQTTVAPVETRSEPLFLVAFLEQSAPPSKQALAIARGEDHERWLEYELSSAQESDQSTVEELEASTEELQSLNQELQSANEELQASNQELQASNEELHSANEELVTVNQELERKTQQLALLAQRQRMVIDSIPSGIAVLDGSGTIIAVNAAWRRFAVQNGYRDRGYGVGRNYVDICDRATGNDREGAAEVAEGLRKVLAGEVRSLHFDYPCQSAGVRRWFRVLMTGGGGLRRRGAVLVHADITGEVEMSRTVARQTAALQSAANAIFITGRDGQIDWVNESCLRLSGYSSDELLGRTPEILEAPQNRHSFDDVVRECRMRGASWSGEITNRNKAGQTYTVRQTVTPIPSAHGEFTHFVVVQEDITSHKQAQAQVMYMAEHDDLTGLWNRKTFQDRLSQAIARQQSHGGHLALLFLDLDRFKDTNDTLGHLAGDQVLLEISRRLRRHLPDGAGLGRFGGDEFVIFLEGVDGRGHVTSTLDRLLRSFAQPIQVSGRPLFISASIGVTMFPEDGSSTGQLLRNADLAMYRAKSEGRRGYRFYDHTLEAEINQRVSIERDLNRALGSKELWVAYQPQFDLRTGHMVGAEALLRWERADEQTIAIGQVVRVAEEAGLILPISHWVLKESLASLQHWHKRGYPLRLSVNLSAVQFHQQDVFGIFTESTKARGLPPWSVKVEITESVLLHGSVRVKETLHALHGAGFGLVLDDFGTGYSSLSYLQQFPIEAVKIDASFLGGIGRNRNDETIVTGIIRMAHALGQVVVAEGVETQAQLDFLKRHECDYGQGFLLARPMTAAEFETLFMRVPMRPTDGVESGWSLSANA